MRLRCAACGTVEERQVGSVVLTQSGTPVYNGSSCSACGSVEGATDAEQNVFKEPVVETTLIGVRCTCRWGRVPVHIVRGTRERLRLHLGMGPGLNADEPLLTVRCRNCNGYVHITLNHLGLVAETK